MTGAEIDVCIWHAMQTSERLLAVLVHRHSYEAHASVGGRGLDVRIGQRLRENNVAGGVNTARKLNIAL